jgi:glutamyl-tRNA reductase
VVALREHVRGVLEDEIARGVGADTEAALRHFSGVLLHGLIARGHSLAAGGHGTEWADAVETVLPPRPASPDRAGGTDAAEEPVRS